MSEETKPVAQLLPNLNTYTYLPITMKQFETLANELLMHLNTKAASENTQGFGGDYMAQILTSVIHGLDKKDAKMRKEELFDRCLVSISRHVSYHLSNEIQNRLKPQEGSESAPMNPNLNEPLPDEVVGEPAPEAQPGDIT